MPDRTRLSTGFLTAAGWGHAERTLLAGDASNRRYDRLRDPLTGKTAILMDSPPDRGEDVRPFIRITHYLQSVGLSPPEIRAADTGNGFLLLEDLGNDLFARVARVKPGLERSLYEAATDTLIAMHRHAPPADMGSYDPQALAELAALSLDWYPRGSAGAAVSPGERAAFCEELGTVLDEVRPERPVLILRDYHAENLLWLPMREGVKRVGLLDYQDAMLGHPAYDLVSLLQDARRDVPPDLREAMLSRYISVTGQEDGLFRAACAVLGAQRNLRILGVFARLSLHFGKPHYVDMIPRVWAHLMADLAHPRLSGLRERVVALLPPPDAATLKRIRTPCGTVPTL